MRVFRLEIRTDAAAGAAALKLVDPAGVTVAGREWSVGQLSASRWQMILQPRVWLRRERSRPEAEVMAEMGAVLAHDLLGAEITEVLGQGIETRTLEVRLAGADALSLALARVPWELATAHAGRTLHQNNVAVRLCLPGAVVPAPLALDDQPLRVLMVSSLAEGAAPLALRQERQALLALLHDEVMPDRRVEVEVLAHGLTLGALREALVRPVHVLCWSGHGRHDRLVLNTSTGKDELSGAELVDLMADAGGSLPALILLNACESGSTLAARDWAELYAALRDAESVETRGGELAPLAPAGGYAGVAAALLAAGVPQVVAMRVEVGDVAARALSVGLLRRLFIDGLPVDQALRQTRKDTEWAVRKGELAGVSGFDLYTPVLFAAGSAPVQPPVGRAAQLERWEPQPWPLLPDGRRDLHPRALFVGRGAELDRLANEWLARDSTTPIAVIQGLAGQGKTSLAAEAVALWHGRFGFALAFQALPDPLSPDHLHKRIHQRLLDASPSYAARIKLNATRAVHIEEARPDRWDRMRDNLLAALREERVLLVLDNFETCQEEIATGGRFRARDPEWDGLFERLARDLVGSGARVLLTTRRRLMVESGALWLALGPLPVGEAALMLRELPAFQALFTDDPADRARLERALSISRGHPLILEKLAGLATDRAALDRALDALGAHGYAGLPDLFTASRGDEQTYLAEVAGASIDLLLHRLSPLARRLCWMIQVADEPLTEAVIKDVWTGRSRPMDVKQKTATLLALLEGKTEEMAKLPPAQVAMLRSFANMPLPERPPGEQADWRPLLAELHSAGLVHPEGGGWALHPLVRERVRVWIEGHPLDRGARDEREILRLLADDYEFAFSERLSSGDPGARGLAVEAGRRALAYRVRTDDLGQVWPWIVQLVASAAHPAAKVAVADALVGAVRALPAHLVTPFVAAVVGAAQLGARRLHEADRWLSMADGAELSAAEKVFVANQRAILYAASGRLREARDAWLEAGRLAEAAGQPRQAVLSSALEALAIAARFEPRDVAPQVDAALVALRDWWARRQGGEIVPEAPDREALGRGLSRALEIRLELALFAADWALVLDLCDEMAALDAARGEPPVVLASLELNRCSALMHLKRPREALVAAQRHQDLFRSSGDWPNLIAARTFEAQAWSCLADHERAAEVAAQTLAIAEQAGELGRLPALHDARARALTLLGRPEAGAHLIAGLTWNVLAGDLRGVVVSLHGIAQCRDLARPHDQPFALPSLATVIADPDFSALKQAVEASGVPVAQLQATLDQALAQLPPASG